MKYTEIAVVSLLGAVIGLFTGLHFNLALWLVVPCGAIAGFLCYRPWEILSAIMEICTEILVGIIYLKNRRTGIVRRVARELAIVLASVAYYGSLIIVFCFSASLILFPLFFMEILPRPDRDTGPFQASFIFGLMWTIIGAGALFLLLGMSARKGDSILFPLSAALANRLGLDEPIKKLNYLQWLKETFMVPLILQGGSLLLIPLIITDILLAFILLCATTRRLACTLGATMGCGIGVVAQLAGLDYASGILVLGGITGSLFGTGAFWLRQRLEEKSKTALSLS